MPKIAQYKIGLNFMRLNEKEVAGIVEALGIFLINGPAELRLYGSRVDDQAKGGDIDLLVIFEDQESAAKLIYKKPEILVAMKKLLGERRIDLKIAAVAELNEDPFLKTVFPKSILLHRYL
jgi:hypothetical protein